MSAEPLREPEPTPTPEPQQLVNLDQLAAMVRLGRRTLQAYVSKMPPPVRPGRGGRSSLWAWSDVRPWLVETFGMPRLPERLPESYGR